MNREPSSTDLQAESQQLLARIRPLCEGLEMTIKRNEGSAAAVEEAISDVTQQLKQIAHRYREVQRLIVSGEATRAERVLP